MAGHGTFQLKRLDGFHHDPLLNLCIITATRHPDAGPKDRVDPKHTLCEQCERPISQDDIRDVNRRGIVQAIRVLKDGDELGIVVAGRRRTRMVRAANVLRAGWNDGDTNWLFPVARDAMETALPLLTVPAIPLKAREEDGVILRGTMLAENLRRANYTPSQIAEQIRDYILAGATEDMAAELCADNVPEGRNPAEWIADNLNLNVTAPEVRAAVDSGELALGTAAELAGLPRAEQKDVLDAAPVVDGKRHLTRSAVKGIKRAKAGKKALRKRVAPKQIAAAIVSVAPWTDKGSRKETPAGWTRDDLRAAADVLAWTQGKPSRFAELLASAAETT